MDLVMKAPGLLRKHWEGAAYTVLMLILMAPMAFVFFWMVSLSFRTNVEATASPPVFIPRNPTLAGYQFVFNRIGHAYCDDGNQAGRLFCRAGGSRALCHNDINFPLN